MFKLVGKEATKYHNYYKTNAYILYSILKLLAIRALLNFTKL